MHPWFFGYGSLVNRATHAYANARPARIRGWRRAWRHVAHRDVAFLTAVPDADSEIEGLVAEVPGGDWAVLDAREFSYDRVPAREVMHELAPDTAVHLYWAPPEKHAPATTANPVLMSYVEVVVQGYLREFGEEGVRRFFATTDGWDAPLRDDRSSPIYARHQPIAADERLLAEDMLRSVGARWTRF